VTGCFQVRRIVNGTPLLKLIATRQHGCNTGVYGGQRRIAFRLALLAVDPDGFQRALRISDLLRGGCGLLATTADRPSERISPAAHGVTRIESPPIAND
jgi:hypothetical protein